jgi:hypothetical protein
MWWPFARRDRSRNCASNSEIAEVGQNHLALGMVVHTCRKKPNNM